MKSIKKHLLVSIMAILFLGTAVTTTAAYYELKEEMDELFDENLKQVAQAIAVHDISAHSNFSDVGKKTSRSSLKGEEEFLIQIWHDKDLSYSSLPAQDFPYLGPDGVKTVRFGNQAWRYYGLAHGDDWLIQVSQPIPLRHTVIWEIYSEILIPLLIQFPLVAGLIWVFIRRGFLPLARVSSLIEKRDASFLGSLPEDDIPEEVSVMVHALNGLLARLDQALATQRQFTADAAHELRTPLTAVRLELDVLKRADTDQDRMQSIETLLRAVDRSTHMVQQMLELARQEPELFREEVTTVSLKPLIHEAMMDFMPLAQSRKIDLAIGTVEDAAVHGAQHALSVMIGNLIGNAVLYTQENGKVRVSARREDGRAFVLIADNGPGIPSEERSRVFDRFYRILDSRSSNITGSGLGLSIVKAIADRHKATIRITDGLDGQGTGFEISL